METHRDRSRGKKNKTKQTARDSPRRRTQREMEIHLPIQTETSRKTGCEKTGNLIAREKERRKGRWGGDRATKGEFNRKRDRMQQRQKQRKVRSKGTVQK